MAKQGEKFNAYIKVQDHALFIYFSEDQWEGEGIPYLNVLEGLFARQNLTS